ncbi:MAG: hypothetical protein ACON46_08570 [Coraliomargaritaceae bacterium]
MSLDAPTIAVIWQLSIAETTNLPINTGASGVLFLSVWLTYAADRLFDARKHPLEVLQTARHKWAKRNHVILWRIWFFVLFLNVLLAVLFLESWQLKQGIWLLSASLLYTLLNQTMSQYWFPKEAFVGVIFSAGVLIFLPITQLLDYLVVNSTVFFANCLIISYKDKSVSESLGERSVYTLRAQYMGCILLTCFALNLIFFSTNQKLILPTTVTLLLIGGLFRCRERCTGETYHLFADLCLLPAPLMVLFLG